MIGYLGAFLGGLFALVSPCGALLLPAFFAYAFAGRAALATRTGVFYQPCSTRVGRSHPCRLVLR